MLEAQPQWANHGKPQLNLAWDAAATAGLDVTAARAAMDAPEITRRLTQEMADVKTVGVRQTPTFFVDGRPLLNFGADELRNMVRVQVEAMGT